MEFFSRFFYDDGLIFRWILKADEPVETAHDPELFVGVGRFNPVGVDVLLVVGSTGDLAEPVDGAPGVLQELFLKHDDRLVWKQAVEKMDLTHIVQFINLYFAGILQVEKLIEIKPSMFADMLLVFGTYPSVVAPEQDDGLRIGIDACKLPDLFICPGLANIELCAEEDPGIAGLLYVLMVPLKAMLLNKLDAFQVGEHIALQKSGSRFGQPYMKVYFGLL